MTCGPPPHYRTNSTLQVQAGSSFAWFPLFFFSFSPRIHTVGWIVFVSCRPHRRAVDISINGPDLPCHYCCTDSERERRQVTMTKWQQWTNGMWGHGASGQMTCGPRGGRGVQWSIMEFKKRIWHLLRGPATQRRSPTCRRDANERSGLCYSPTHILRKSYVFQIGSYF